jgi:hypothetical protein
LFLLKVYANCFQAFSFEGFVTVRTLQERHLVPVTLCRHHGRPALITDKK